jgi:site-specific DNA recombinase
MAEPLLLEIGIRMDNNTAVILARVSSKSQEDEGYSLDSQLKLLQSYCGSNDLKVVKIYKIAETASKELSRKVFNELLVYMHENNVYNLAVEKTDRLTRNYKDAVAIDDWLDGDGQRMLHAVKESLKLHKASKSDVKFMWNIHLAVAKKYTDNLREEAMKGWAEKLAQGWLPSRPPIGYMTAIQNGKRIHVPDPEKSRIIKKAFELYVQSTESTATIWAFLQQSNITTYNNHPLAKSAVHRLLQNPYYMGVIQFDGETYPGAHQPLITQTLFKAVQTKMHSGRPAKVLKHDIPLKNVMTCGHCGKAITWQLQKGHRYGGCQRDLPECKQNKFLREEIIHELLIEKLDTLISPSQEIVQWMVNHLESQFETNNDIEEQQKKSIELRIDRLKKMEDMLYDDKLAGDITQERYESKRVDIQKQLQDLQDELLIAGTTIAQKHNEAIDLIKLTQHAKEEYLDENLSNDEKRTILTKLFKSIVYINNSISVTYSFLADSIALKSKETREIMAVQNIVNQTNKKDPNNGGRSVDNLQLALLRPVWQGHVESNHDPRFWRPIY